MLKKNVFTIVLESIASRLSHYFRYPLCTNLVLIWDTHLRFDAFKDIAQHCRCGCRIYIRTTSGWVTDVTLICPQSYSLQSHPLWLATISSSS